MICDSPIGVDASVVSAWIQRVIDGCMHEVTPSSDGEYLCTCQRFIRTILAEYITELKRRSERREKAHDSIGVREALEEIDRQANLEIELAAAQERVFELERRFRALKETFRVFLSNTYTESERNVISTEMEKNEI